MSLKITVLRKMRYQGIYIYILQFGTIFQYLFAQNGDVNQNNITFHPGILRWLGYWLRLIPLYSSEQLETGEQIILSGAMQTIDELIKKGEITIQKKEVHKRKLGKRCEWQARHGGAKGKSRFWVCIVHGEAIDMVDGVKPKHD